MTKHVPKVSTRKHNGIEDDITGNKIEINLFNYKAGSLAS